MQTIQANLGCAFLCILAALAGGCSKEPVASSVNEPAASGSKESTVFRIGAIPYEDTQQEKEQFGPFGDYIGRKVVGAPATVTIAMDYVGVITALENSQIDIAYLNPLSYAIAADRAQKAGHPLIPIAMPYVIKKGSTKGDLTYEGVIFVRADSKIHSLTDLKGKTFAFNEPTSTSGYLYPAALLLKAGVNPKPQSSGGDLKEARFAGAQGVVPSVFNGQSDAGAIFEEGISLAYPDPAKQKQLRVLARTDPIPQGMIVARGDLPPAEVQKLKAAFVSINKDADGRQAMASQRVEKWVPANDSLFDPVRKAAAVLDLHLKIPERKAK